MSEVSIDSIERNGFITNSVLANPTNSMSRFHRSLSMGQGWSSQGQYTKYAPINTDLMTGQLASKVVLRRRNNSTCEGIGISTYIKHV